MAGGGAKEVARSPMAMVQLSKRVGYREVPRKR